MSDPVWGIEAISALVALAVGALAGRVARVAADRDTARRTGRPGRSSGWGIEVTTALALYAVTVALGPDPVLAPFPVVLAAAVAVTVTDLRHRRIPDRIVFPALALGAVIMAVAAVGSGQPERLSWAAWGAGLYGGVLGAVHAIRPAGLGRGDVKLALLLGGALGWLRPPLLDTVLLVVWALLAASLLGLVFAFAFRARDGRAGAGLGERPVSLRTTEVPFGPALSGAALGVVLMSGRLLA